MKHTTLIGSIFYHGHRIMSDESKGEFDTLKAESLLSQQDELSYKTGNPSIVDVVGSSADALVREVEFVADHTKFPILLDGSTPSVRISALNELAKSGLNKRIIYNSLSHGYKQDEVDAIVGSNILGTILLSNDLTSFRVNARVKFLEDNIVKLGKVNNLMLDTCVLDVPTLGVACETIKIIKKSHPEYLVGCGAHNAVGTWRSLKLKYPEARVSASVATVVLCVSSGADWVLYGPIGDAKQIFPATLLADQAIQTPMRL